jgi:hypothetical protein
LQTVALNEGLRWKKRLWRDAGRKQLESFRLSPWVSRRRRDLLELLDRLAPTSAELTLAIEQEVEKCPAAQCLQTHAGVGALTALAFVLIIGRADGFQSGKADRELSGTGAAGAGRAAAALGAHHGTRELVVVFPAGGSGASNRAQDREWRRKYFHWQCGEDGR